MSGLLAILPPKYWKDKTMSDNKNNARPITVNQSPLPMIANEIVYTSAKLRIYV
jgi:hypothetical protein